MSCEGIDQQVVRLGVSLGALPEGFCPTSMQELGEAIAARLIITPNATFSSFAIGPIAPTSNVGPWLKDCEEWWVFDSSIAGYRPIAKGGFNQLAVIESSQDFVVPAGIFRIQAEAWGGGGGGCSNGATSGGGSSGSYGLLLRDVTPGQTIPCVVGTGGASGNPGTAGGNTTVLGMTAGGGGGGLGSGEPVTAGVTSGADFGIQGQSSSRSGSTPGEGGDAPNGGGGGRYSGASAAFAPGKIPGGAGCGSTAAIAGGIGARGVILIRY